VSRYDSERSEHVDGLTGREGAFLACSFWLVDDLHLIGRHDDAIKLFERLLLLRTDLGLLAEEYDPVAGRLVGNFPQAFSHVSAGQHHGRALGEGPGLHPRAPARRDRASRDTRARAAAEAPPEADRRWAPDDEATTRTEPQGLQRAGNQNGPGAPGDLGTPVRECPGAPGTPRTITSR